MYKVKWVAVQYLPEGTDKLRKGSTLPDNAVWGMFIWQGNLVRSGVEKDANARGRLPQKGNSFCSPP